MSAQLGSGVRIVIAAMAIIRSLFRDPNSGVRIALVRAMGRTGTIPDPLRPPYLELMEDKDVEVRTEAVRWIPYQDLASRVFIEALLTRLKDPSTRSRSAAAQKLAQSHFTQQIWNREGGYSFQTHTRVAFARSPTALAVLNSAASDPDPIVRTAAAGLLPVWKGAAAIVIPVLTDRLKALDGDAAAAAYDALATVGKPALPAVLASTRDDDPVVRNVSISLLSLMANPGPVRRGGSPHPRNPAIRAALCSALGNRDERI
ncbi:MAG: HEAT repeat domain-containing protein [Isosphaeraceae bacterium]